jgi:hypothetical protein
MQQMRTLYDLNQLSQYTNVVITGGEPLINPRYTEWVVNRLVDVLPIKANIYLYTTLWHNVLDRIGPVLNGLTFTLHSGARHGVELEDFRRVQELSLGMPHMTNRLVIYPHVPPITIVPEAWQRITKQVYATEDELLARNPNTGLPAGEDLYCYQAWNVREW